MELTLDMNSSMELWILYGNYFEYGFCMDHMEF